MDNFNVTVEDFVSHLTRTRLASPNRYWIEFTLPTSSALSSRNPMAGTITDIEKNLNQQGFISMRCHTATFPQRSLMTTENRHYHMPYKLPYAPMYDPVTFAFTASEDLAERQYFDAWQRTVYNVDNNSLNFYYEYVSTVKMYQLNKKGDVTYGVQLFEAYPINIGQVDYSYATTNSTQNVIVTLSYRYWKQIYPET